MRVKGKELMLTWNVYYHNFNAQKIEAFNVFDHGRFLEDCRKAILKNKEDREAFLEEVRKDLMYYYWSKAEWEILLGGLITREDERPLKIDVYDQLRLNWEPFCDYLWSHRAELKPKKRKL